MTMQRGKKLSEVVAREILKDAMRRKMPPGSRLAPEQEMVETLDIGRASLREALRILEVQGLLTIRPGPGGGPFLNEVSSRDFGAMSSLYFMVAGSTNREVIEARVWINPMLARMAAQRGIADAGDMLEAALSDTASVIDADDRTWIETSARFYPVVGALSGNGILAMYASSLQDIYLDHLPPLGRDKRVRTGILASHRHIADAIIAGDATEAERLTADAMDAFMNRLSTAFPAFLERPVDWQ